MTIIQTITTASSHVQIEKVVISNSNLTRALYVGIINDIPETLRHKEAKSYRYDFNKKRLIVRV